MPPASRFAALLGAGILLFTPACDQPRTRIVGKWKVQNDASATVWEFSPNGTVKAGNTEGRFTFGDRRRIKIQTQSATFVYEIELRDEVMIWTEPNGSRMELRRVP